MNHQTIKEFQLRLDNIERTLKDLTLAVRTIGGTPEAAAPDIKMIARELVNTPDLYLMKRQMEKAKRNDA